MIPSKPKKPSKKTATKTNRSGSTLGAKVLWALALIALTGFAVVLFKPITLDSTHYLVSETDTYSSVINRLEKNGQIQSTLPLRLYRKFFIHHQLKSGVYTVPKQTTAWQLLHILSKSTNQAQFKLTIIEGTTLKELIKKVSADPQISQTLGGLTADKLIKEIDPAAPFAEGMFAPDTYFFGSGSLDVSIFKKLYARQQQLLDAAWAAKAPNLPYKNKYDALIMASIVEKETGSNDERARVAGVFVSRLQKGMRLQTDPTVIYGMGDQYNGNIRKKDLLTATPFNTYTIYGLPPTPIALPSQASIEAALHPEMDGSLYFVASGTGGHVFSKTLEEHNAAVQRYLKRLREQRIRS